MDFLCNSTMYPVGVKLVSHKIPYSVACELPGLTAESRAKLMYRTRSCSSERCSFRAMALESSADQMSLLRYCTGHATRNRRVFTYSYVGPVPVCLKKMASVRLHSRLQFPERCRGSKNWCSMEVNSTNIFQIFSAGYEQTALDRDRAIPQRAFDLLGNRFWNFVHKLQLHRSTKRMAAAYCHVTIGKENELLTF